MGSARFSKSDTYTLEARFSSVSGVNSGSRVEIGGVRIGTVKDIVLSDNFFAIVTMEIPNRIELDDDTIASAAEATEHDRRNVRCTLLHSRFIV